MLEYGRAERSGDPSRLARALAELYADASHTPAQQLMVTRLEDRLLPALATALGEPEGQLRERLHTGRAPFAGDARWVPEATAPTEPTAPPDWQRQHTFSVFGEALVLGAQPDDVERTLTLAVPNGRWHVFHVTQRSWFGGLFGRKPPLLVAVHDRAVAQGPRLLAAARVLEHTEDRVCSLVDAAARTDQRIRADIDMGSASARSFTFMTDAPTQEWRGAKDADDRLVLVSTALDFED